MIHSKPEEEVAMDTAGAERPTCSEAGNRKASGGKRVITRAASGGSTYALQCVRSVPGLVVC